LAGVFDVDFRRRRLARNAWASLISRAAAAVLFPGFVDTGGGGLGTTVHYNR